MTIRATDSDASLISMALRAKAEGDRAIAATVLSEMQKGDGPGIKRMAETLEQQAKRAFVLADAIDAGELVLPDEDI